MVQDYSISKCTRRCAVSDRPLEPGERFVSMLVDDGGEVRRIDVAASEWQQPNEETIGYWKCQMPEAEAKRLRPAPNGVLLDTLSDLLGRPGQETLAFLLALLLVRRRVLSELPQLELDRSPATQADSGSPLDAAADLLDGSGLRDARGHLWRLVSPGDGRQWEVPMAEPSAEQLVTVQAQLYELLFTEA